MAAVKQCGCTGERRCVLCPPAATDDSGYPAPATTTRPEFGHFGGPSRYWLCLGCNRLVDTSPSNGTGDDTAPLAAPATASGESADAHDAVPGKRPRDAASFPFSAEDPLITCDQHGGLVTYAAPDGLEVVPEFFTAATETAALAFLDIPAPTASGALAPGTTAQPTAAATQTSDDKAVAEPEGKAKTVALRPYWTLSQSGRKKQDFGPQANFKKRKAKFRSDWGGSPLPLRGILTEACAWATAHSIVTPPSGSPGGAPSASPSDCHDASTEAARSVGETSVGMGHQGSEAGKGAGADGPLQEYRLAEFSALEYLASHGSAIDPHVDDEWIWGERILGLSLSAPTVMTFVRRTHYGNSSGLVPVHHGASKDGSNRSGTAPSPKLSTADVAAPTVSAPGAVDSTVDSTVSAASCGSHPVAHPPSAVPSAVFSFDVCLPRRSMFVMRGEVRHDWLHGIAACNVRGRRISLTLRELEHKFRKEHPVLSAATDKQADTWV